MRYDESTATALLHNMRKLQNDYGGKICNLYDKANCDEQEISKRLMTFSRVGELTVNIFLRELRLVWPVDPEPAQRVVDMAERLGIDLSQFDRRSEHFMRLEAALLRLSFRTAKPDINSDWDSLL